MANITTKSTTALSAAAFVGAADTGFTEAKPKSNAGGTGFLKIDTQTGEWTFGQEGTVPPADAVWAVIPATFATGFAAWKGKTLEGKRMALIGTPPIDPNTLGPVVAQNGWQESVAVGLILIESPSHPELVGTPVIFETVSVGGLEAWNKLFDATIARARAGSEDFNPIVTLANSSYEHKVWGTVYKPVFVLDDWDTPENITKEFGDGPTIQLGKDNNDPQAEGAPVQAEGRRRRVEAPAAAAEKVIEDAEVVSEQAPRRRRRSE
jgi:hypothetical protein